MRPLRGIAAVMLDLDGTLLDTIPDLAAAATRMSRAMGLPPCTEDQVRAFVGKGIPMLVQRCLEATVGAARAPQLQDEALDHYYAFYLEESGRRSGVYPGVPEGLARFRAMGLPLACVTNKAERFTLPLLAQTGLSGYFQLVVSGDTLPRKKPDPMQLAHICTHFGFAPGKVLMVGDSVNDARAARAAGCPVVCVSYGYNEGEDVRNLDCDAIVDSLLDAANLLNNASS